MELKKLTLRLICGVAPLLATTALANGSLYALTSVDETHYSYENGSAGEGYSFGWEFQMNEDAQVTDLGLLDLGFTSNHEVGIWSTLGQLLGSATVAQNATPDSNGFAWVNLGTPISLSAGQDYVISAWYPTDSGHSDNFAVFGTGPGTSAGVTYVSAEPGLLTTSFDYPNNANPAFNAGLFGPNFQYTPVAAPEPASFLLLTAGASALLLYGRRRTIRSR